MDQRLPIIRTKIRVPGRRHDLVQRPRLVDFIHEHVDRRLILVSAAAGYGKTSLLVDYAQDTYLPVCWYSVDEWDRDPRVFLEYLVASIRETFPTFGEKALGALQEGVRAGELRSIVGTISNEMYEVIPEYFSLIIDDFHLISDDEEVTTIFSLLLRHLPENCHIILASRTTTPGLPIVELMARQQLAGLGNEDLRFTASEIQQLLKQNHNLDLPTEEAERLARQSEGWITAILLTTHTLWKGLLRTMTRAQGDNSHVFAYLAREVLEQQEEQVQSFLKSSSLLERMNPQFCDELLGIDNSRQMLALLENKNLFISRLEGDGGDWFRYHQLFQEFLSAKLREDSDRHRSLHLKAGEIFEREQSWDEAIRHYLQAEVYERAAGLVERVAGWAFRSGRWSSLLFWIESLSKQVMPSPWILYWQSKVFTDSGRLDEAIRTLQRAKDEFAVRADRVGTVKALLEESYIHRLRGEYEQAMAKAEQVLSTVSGTEEKTIMALAHRTLGTCHGLQGRLDEGVAQLEEALRVFEELADDYNLANTLHDMGTIYSSTDDAKFLHYSRKALVYWRRLGVRGPLAMTLNNVGVVQYRQGRFDRALETLQEALSESRAMGLLRPQAYAEATIGDVYRARAEYALAQQAYQRALALADQAGEGFLVSYLLDALANVQRVLGDFERAEEFISQAIDQAYQHGSDYEVSIFQISQGVLLHAVGRESEGLKVLQHALTRLVKLGAGQELARGYFHLASALFSLQEVGEAMLNLEMALDTLADAGFDPLLLDEGTKSRPLLEHAVAEAGFDEHTVLLHRLLSRTEPVGQVVALPEAKPIRLEFCAFGPSRVRRNGVSVEAQELRLGAREMLFYFLTHPAVTKEQMVAALWPDLSLAKAHSTFHFYLFQVRRLLGGSGSIPYEGGVYRLETRQYSYDVDEFQRAVAKAEKAPGAQREAYLREAISLCPGDYVEDIYSEWTEETRASLRRAYVRAVEALAAHYAKEGKPDQAIELYRRILDRDSLREDIHCQVMRCLARVGDRGGVMRQFEELRATLSDELGAGPSPETSRLYEDLVTDQP